MHLTISWQRHGATIHNTLLGDSGPETQHKNLNACSNGKHEHKKRQKKKRKERANESRKKKKKKDSKLHAPDHQLAAPQCHHLQETVV